MYILAIFLYFGSAILQAIMEKFKTLHTETESRILIITFNKPEMQNALSIQCMHELRVIIQQV